MVVHGTEESLQTVTWQNGGTRARLAWPAPAGGRMPYVFVRENYFKWWKKDFLFCLYFENTSNGEKILSIFFSFFFLKYFKR